jgi:hypothetical protein
MKVIKLLVCLATVWVAPALLAQQISGSIRSTVIDPSGSRNSTPTANQLSVSQRGPWRVRWDAASGLQQLCCADCSRNVRCGYEHGIGTGHDVCFACAQCRCFSDEFCAVSRFRCLVEARYRALADSYLCSPMAGRQQPSDAVIACPLKSAFLRPWGMHR